MGVTQGLTQRCISDLDEGQELLLDDENLTDIFSIEPNQVHGQLSTKPSSGGNDTTCMFQSMFQSIFRISDVFGYACSSTLVGRS